MGVRADLEGQLPADSYHFKMVAERDSILLRFQSPRTSSSMELQLDWLDLDRRDLDRRLLLVSLKYSDRRDQLEEFNKKEPKDERKQAVDKMELDRRSSQCHSRHLQDRLTPCASPILYGERQCHRTSRTRTTGIWTPVKYSQENRRT